MFLCRRVSSAMISCSLRPVLRINTDTPSRQFTNPLPFTAFAEIKHTVLLKDSYNSSSPPPLLWIPRGNPLHKKNLQNFAASQNPYLRTLSKTKIRRLRKLLAAKTSAAMSQNWNRRISACKQHVCSQRTRYCAGRLSSEIVEATAKPREEGLELRLGGRLTMRRRGKGDGQRAGKMKKRIKTRCRVNPDNQKEKCPLHLR